MGSSVMHCNLSLGPLIRLVSRSEFKYRDRISIVKDILDTVNETPHGKTKTSIMRSANLNFDQVNKYLDMLTLCDLIKAQDPMESYEVARYRVTGKGLRIARSLTELQFALHPLLQRPI